MPAAPDTPTSFDQSDQSDRSDPSDSQSEIKRRHITETLTALTQAVDPAKLTPLSNKSVEEVTKLQQEIAEVMPVGNVSGLILNGLAQLKDRVIPPVQAQRDVEALMRGLEVLQKAFYGVAFASPAAILYGYQKMLTLTGKDIQSAFPEGLWQFYLEFSMREDTARHTNETIGFQQNLAAYKFKLPLHDQLAAWAAATINLYFQYDDLLLTEWSERVYLNLLEREVEKADYSQDPFFQNFKKKWMKQKLYRREQDATETETFSQYRQRRFHNFYRPRLQSLPHSPRQQIADDYQHLVATAAPAFQQQMSILATLDPERYRETRRPIPLWQARVAIIWQDEYHLLPACAIDDQGQILCFDLENPKEPPIPLTVNRQGHLIHPQHGQVTVQRNGLILAEKTPIPIGQVRPLPFNQLRYWVWAIIHKRYLSNLAATTFDARLLQMPRNKQDKARRKLTPTDRANLALLKMAPIIINWDERDYHQPLATARLGRRGVGDQALTIFRTQRTMIFDQSHIFFDGAWGLSLGEILTNEAISWAYYLAQLPPLETIKSVSSTDTVTLIQVAPEAAAESIRADLEAMVYLRRNLVERAHDIVFTINDLLILYRTFFNREYRPSDQLVKAVNLLGHKHARHARDIQQAWRKLKTVNPALLIPMDAIDGPPKDRLYPISFRNPSPEFLDLFYQTYNALGTYQQTRTSGSWKTFNQLRNKLFREIYYFGQLMLVHKKLTSAEQSTNLATLKLLGHLPDVMQSLLGKIPQKIDFLNEMLKGEEVFSNVGRVARGTSPRRLISARDDNDAKTLVWGILTDDQGTMYISLRDFRPQVSALFDINRADLAQMMAYDFLDGYISGLNNFVSILNQIAITKVEETL